MISGIFHILRLARAGFILAREGVFLDVDPSLVPPAGQPAFFLMRKLARAGAADHDDSLARAMARLGPSYVKLGQFLATRPDIVGIETARSLEQLQDRMAPFPQAEAIPARSSVLSAKRGRPPRSTIPTSFGRSISINRRSCTSW